MDFFSTQNILVHIPIGAGGYDLSWIEAVGTIAGLLCIGLASLEKISNYFFGLINVTLFGIIFFQIQLYASLLLQVFFFAANIYGWYAWSRQTSQHEAELKIRWLPLPKALTRAGGLCRCHWPDDSIYQSCICVSDPCCSNDYARVGITGCDARTATGCLPVLGFLHDGVIHRGHDSDDA